MTEPVFYVTLCREKDHSVFYYGPECQLGTPQPDGREASELLLHVKRKSLAQIFPEWTNHIPRIALPAGVLVVAFIVFGIWYWWSPRYTDVGYAPVQPVAYSHKLHVGQLGLDCRYCHTGVEKSSVAMVPPTRTCMNCHTLVKPDSPKLAVLRSGWENRTPMEWVRVHKVPDYAYFDHSVHLRAGVGCESCHGAVSDMETVTLAQPLSMSWCLDCHRDPNPRLRPASAITAMHWTPAADQAALAAEIVANKKLKPPTNCSGCHR